MKDSKPFFYRIEAAEFFAIVRGHKTDKELGAFIRQLSSDLVARDGNSDYAKKVISEAIEYINKKKVSGSKGGKQRVSNAQASLKHRLKNASSKTQASTEAVTETESLNPKKHSPGNGKFIPPTIEEIKTFCEGRKNGIDPEGFFHHYEARNWIPKGYTKPMTSWKSTIITWEKNNKNHAGADDRFKDW